LAEKNEGMRQRRVAESEAFMQERQSLPDGDPLLRMRELQQKNEEMRRRRLAEAQGGTPTYKVAQR
jgi:hypothetical protein